MSSIPQFLFVSSLAGLLGAGTAVAQVVIHPGPPVHVRPIVSPQPFCAIAIDPAPNGPTGRPLDVFADPALFPNPTNSNDYHWVHSGTHLQGMASTQKFAACAFYDSPVTDQVPDLSGFRTALVVDNPNPGVAANVTLSFRDAAGNVFATRFVTVPAEGFYFGGADVFSPALGGPGFGSIEVLSDVPVVGATIHHLRSGAIRIGGIPVVDPDVIPFSGGVRPGEGTMQQLQISQNATRLVGGPYPLTNTAAEDFLNGLLPFNCILNASPNPTTLTVGSFLAGGTPVYTVSMPLPAFGLFLDTGLWALAEPFYLSGPGPFSVDAINVAVASDGGSLVGETIQADFFSNGPGGNLNLGGRFRMTSAEMALDPVCQLVNPEVIRTNSTPTPPVETYMLVANGSGNSANVTTEFFPRDGGAPFVRTDVVPPLGVVRITSSTGPFPTSFAGWARLRSNQPGIVGWSAREINQQIPPTSPNHFRKAYGEVLSGGNRDEPGRGLSVVVAGTPVRREVAPINRAGNDLSSLPFWPGYAIGVNSTAANLGPYSWRWFEENGIGVGTAGFQGLQFARTSFTHVDPMVFVTQDLEVSGRFDRAQGNNIEGLDVIGDPLQEWSIPGLFFPGAAGGTFQLPGEKH